ncbi:hypothetical protein KM043_008067 [Ampulex compressa]|nr:hypothetical protein KM043_008067 [Ampulex compressa]
MDKETNAMTVVEALRVPAEDKMSSAADIDQGSVTWADTHSFEGGVTGGGSGRVVRVGTQPPYWKENQDEKNQTHEKKNMMVQSMKEEKRLGAKPETRRGEIIIPDTFSSSSYVAPSIYWTPGDVEEPTTGKVHGSSKEVLEKLSSFVFTGSRPGSLSPLMRGAARRREKNRRTHRSLRNTASEILGPHPLGRDEIQRMIEESVGAALRVFSTNLEKIISKYIRRALGGLLPLLSQANHGDPGRKNAAKTVLPPSSQAKKDAVSQKGRPAPEAKSKSRRQQVERRDAGHDQTAWSKVVGRQEKSVAKKKRCSTTTSFPKNPGCRVPLSCVASTSSLRCDKCLLRGHVKELCPSYVNRGDKCYRCGVPGHNSRSCQASPNCPLCSDLGKPADHCLGVLKCTQVRRDGSRREQKGKKNTSPPAVTPTELQPIAGCSGVVRKWRWTEAALRRHCPNANSESTLKGLTPAWRTPPRENEPHNPPDTGEPAK